MNLIDIVKNAPEGAKRYKVLVHEGGAVAYYATINGKECFFSSVTNSWLEKCVHYKSSLPLPKLKTSYKKVEGVIWDLEDDFNAGELYHKLSNSRDFVKIENIETLAQAVNQAACYLRIDKIIDEREEFKRKMMKLRIEWESENEGLLDDFLYSKGCRFID